jgi:hypothetical protein
MNKLIKFIATAILTIGLFIGSGASTLHSNDNNVVMNYTILTEFVANEERSQKYTAGEWYSQMDGMTTKHLTLEENTTGHNNFDWRWINHIMYWIYVAPNHDMAYVVFVAKDYQEFVSPDSRGFVLMRVIDYDMDGKADYSDRRWIPVMQNEVIMMPDFPEGLINLDWYRPTQEEADEFLQRETKFWIKTASGSEV